MAKQLNDHFHIFFADSPADDTLASEWAGLAPNLQPMDVPTWTIIAAPQRALDGTFHAHVLSEDDGDPLVITDWDLLVYCSEWDDAELWGTSYNGRIMYFIPHHHDPAAHSSYTQRVLVQVSAPPQPENYNYEFIALPVHLYDAEQE